MAKNCNIKSPVTGEKSEVYDILVKIAKEENFAFEDQVSAHEYWAYLQSPEFKEDFGDWEVPSDTMSERVLASKEPNIFWDKDSKGYFYYNKYNTLTPFPPNEKGLNEFFTDDTVTAIVHHLAYVAFKKHFGEDFSETDILSDPSFNLLTIVRDYLESIKDDYGHIEILLDYQQ